MAPAADLAVSISSPPITVTAGSTVSFDYVLTNAGLSSSSTTCSSRYNLGPVIGSRPIPSLAPSTSRTETVTLIAPATPGAYYFSVDITCSADHVDLDSFNNRAAVGVRIVP